MQTDQCRYLETLLNLYLSLPEKASQASLSDVRLAHSLYQQRIPLEGVALTGRKRFTLSPTKLLVPSRALQELRCAATGMGSRGDPSEPVSNRIRTSTSHCAIFGRRARVLGSRWEAVHAATGTPDDQPPHVYLQEPPRIRL